MPTIFSHASGSVTFSRNPALSVHPLEIEQPLAKTPAGVLFGHEPAVTDRTIPLTWPAMLSSDLDALLLFWTDVVGGAGTPFTYTDASGVELPVSFYPAPIRIAERTLDSAEVSVILLRA